MIDAHIYIKKVDAAAGEEDGEILGEGTGKAYYQRVDRQAKIRVVLEGTVVFEYPTFYVVF